MLGALVMMASMACFTLNDTLIKLTDGEIPLAQLLVMRGGMTLALILTFGRFLGAVHFNMSQRDWMWIALRSASELATTYFFLNALLNMPLPNVTAILQVVPLCVTLASAVVFREQVGWRRMAAVGVGFIGVLLIVRPGTDGFTVWSVYALMAMLFVTIRDLITRQLSPDVPSMSVTLVTALTITTAALLALVGGGAPLVAVDAGQVALLAGSAVFIMGGYYFSILVMRIADASATAPFRYTGLIWALIIGWFVFGDWPASLTLIGAAIVVGTGLFTLYRERIISRR